MTQPRDPDTDSAPAAEPTEPQVTLKVRPGCKLVFLLVSVLLGYVFLWPIPIDPVAWTPPTPPEVALNDRLAAVERLGEAFVGPEDVAIDPRGRLYLGLLDGRVVRLPAPGDEGEPEVLADTGGRPLGLHFDAAGNLLIADADRGLLSLSPAGEITSLATEAEGLRFAFTDDVDVAADGTVWFSDASHRFGVAHYKLDLLEHRLNGRLLAYDPKTQRTRVVLRDLQFANGVAVSRDQRFVLVVETGKYRVTRYWLDGPQQGRHDVFVDNLPGFPDGISARPGGGFWLAIASPRDAVLDASLPYPFVRRVIARLPEAFQPAPQRHAWLLGLDAEGRIVHDLQHLAPDSYSPVTSVQERGGYLHLGSLSHRGCARVPVPE
jgi:sugar lactone lactonase YvrE